MKKLLFTLVAAAAGGVASAVAPTATFDGLTAFDPTKTDAGTVEVDSSNPGYWEVDTSSEPELTIAALSETDKYLQLNTGSTPLWRTFNSVNSAQAATNATATLDAAGYNADGKVVSSDVKLTACTEFPDLTKDFVNEKLALFLFAPEEGDTSGKTNGLYAVGGAMEDGNLTATAYRLNVDPNAITDTDGWATIAIKSYADIMKESGDTKYPAFVIAVGPKDGTLTVASVDAEATYAPGFLEEELMSAAVTRIANRTLIPSAMTSDGTLAGLGFQGEGGIDNVNLDADAVDGMDDAVTMTVSIPKGVGYEGITLGQNGAYSFTSTNAVTFTLNEQAVAGKIVTVDYTGTATYDKSTRTVTFAPVKDATLTITVEDALFDVGGVEYGSLENALAALANGGTLKLLAPLTMTDGANLKFETEVEVTLDLNGQTVSAVGAEFVIYNTAATLTIVDDSEGTMGTIDGAVANEATLILNEGHYNGAITNDGNLTLGVDAKFLDPEGLTPPDGMKFEQGGDNYYTLVEDAGEDPEPEVPTVGDDVGKVVVADGNATVTVTNASESVTVTVPTNFTGTVSAVVPPAVSSIAGVSAAANVTVKAEGFDITGAFEITYDSATKTATIALDEAGSVTIEGEPIPVKPVLADDDAEGVAVAPFEVGANGPEANVKAIPGLTYELILSDSVNGTYGSIVGGGEKTKVKATEKRVNLKDGRADRGTKGFYKVKVTK